MLSASVRELCCNVGRQRRVCTATLRFNALKLGQSSDPEGWKPSDAKRHLSD